MNRHPAWRPRDLHNTSINFDAAISGQCGRRASPRRVPKRNAQPV
jgi:hypothetical protein